MATASRARRKWTKEEDFTLCKETEIQMKQGSLKDWSAIASKLPKRTNKDCRKRWSRINKTIKKGPWDEKEDEALREAVGRFGMRWVNVAEAVGGRYADQCARRWQCLVDISQNGNEWKSAEDERLLGAVKSYGLNWKMISEKFPERTSTSLMNRYYILTKQQPIDETKTLSQGTKLFNEGKSKAVEDESGKAATNSSMLSDKSALMPTGFDFEPSHHLPDSQPFFDTSQIAFPDSSSILNQYSMGSQYFGNTIEMGNWDTYDFNAPLNMTRHSNVSDADISDLDIASPASNCESESLENSGSSTPGQTVLLRLTNVDSIALCNVINVLMETETKFKIET